MRPSPPPGPASGSPRLIERIDWNSITWRHHGASGAPSPAVEAATSSAPTVATRSATSAAHPPLAPPAPTPAVALSVVVVFYNMRREAIRTLQSLARSYQRDVEDLEYEVLVIDNGSDPDQRLSRDVRRRVRSRVPAARVGWRSPAVAHRGA